MRQILLVSSLTLVAAAAGAAPSSTAPAFSSQDIENVRADQRLVQPREPRSAILGPWSGAVYAPAAPSEAKASVPRAELSGEPIEMVIQADGLEVFGPTNQRAAAIRINSGLDAIGAELIPAVAEEAGLDHLDIVDSETLYEATGNCTRYKLRLENVYAELPFTRTSVSGDFATGRKVKSDFNLPGAEVHAELHWTATHFDGPWWCFSTPMDYRASFTVRDLDGALDVTLDTRDGAVAIDEVEAVSFGVEDFEWNTNSWILTTLLGLGFGLYDLFDFSCSGQAECLSEAINEHALSNDNFVDEMVSAVNQAVSGLHRLADGLTGDGLGSVFDVGLTSLQSRTAENTLTSLWDVDVSSNVVADPCASSLYVRAFPMEGAVGNAALTNNDFEVELPFHLLSKLGYLAGKQGVFCATFTQSILGTPRGFSIAPHGSIGVSGAASGDPANTVTLSLPIRITPTSAGITGSVSGTLSVKGSLGVDAGSDLIFTTRSASVSGLSGSVSVSGVTVSAASFASAINAAVESVVDEMDDLELANAVAHTGLADVSIAVGQIVTSGSALVVGLDLR